MFSTHATVQNSCRTHSQVPSDTVKNRHENAPEAKQVWVRRGSVRVRDPGGMIKNRITSQCTLLSA